MILFYKIALWRLHGGVSICVSVTGTFISKTSCYCDFRVINDTFILLHITSQHEGCI